MVLPEAVVSTGDFPLLKTSVAIQLEHIAFIGVTAYIDSSVSL